MDAITLFLLVLETLGIVSFAMSGASAAIKKQMDWFGALVLACATAFGGGVVRDLILKVPVVGFVENQQYVFICMLSTIAVLFFDKHIAKRNKFITLCDSVGLALFTVSATMRSLNAGSNWVTAMMLATLTACGGGIIRDILRNERPFVFYADFYASASMLGSGIIVFMLFQLKTSVQLASLVGGSTVMAIRLFVLLSQWVREQKMQQRQRYDHSE